MSQTLYGDISPRTAAHVQTMLLERAIPYLCLEKFGQTKPLPMRNTKSTVFRRYEALDPTPRALTEGVTPTSKKLTHTDITINLEQYGDLISLSDVVLDTHEDPVLMESVEILGEQAGQMIEIVRYGQLRAGSNVFYTNGTARDSVNTAISLTFQRRVTRGLQRQNARFITRVVRSTPAYGTMAVQASYIGLTHPDAESDIRDMPGFVAAENYGSVTPYENEIGKVEKVRYLTSTIFEPFADAGGAAGGNFLSTSGTNADVYPVLYIGRDSYAIVPLKGKSSLTPMVVNPKPSDSDPLAQRGHAGWKAWQGAGILNDFWFARGEIAVRQ